LYEEEMDYSKRSEAEMRGVVNPEVKRLDPARLEANLEAEKLPEEITVQDFLSHHVLWRVSMAGYESILQEYAGMQCTADEAAIACALERYWLAKGKYPARLEELVPVYIMAIPKDALTGQLYMYRVGGVDGFVLYSVGWNLKDDGGKQGARAYAVDGDWVW
jgi:hypothetical protein